MALPLLVHGLLKPAFAKFCLMCKYGGGAGSSDGAVVLARSRGDPMLPGDVGDPSSAPIPFEFDRAAWAAQNDRFRKKAHEFLSRGSPRPMALAIVLRMCMAPVQSMEKEEFWVGSRKWNAKQAAKAVKGGGSPCILQRDYQCLVHARGEIESKGVHKLRMLMFEQRLWLFLPEVDYTNDLKVAAFLSLTGSEAATERHMGSANRLAPLRVFLTLEQPELIASVKSTKRCMLDAWSAKFLKENDLDSTSAKMKLALHVVLYHSNTNPLELGNASLRRFVKKRVQCHGLGIDGLSEKFLGQFFRAGDGFHPFDDNAYKTAASATGGDARADGEPKSGGGGAWRAFVHKQSSNDLAEVGRLYRALQDAVGSQIMEECIREGKLATANWRSGNVTDYGSFGPKRSKIAALQEKRLVRASLEASTSSTVVDAASGYDRTMDVSVANSDRPEDVLRRVKLLRAEVSSLQRQDDRNDCALVEAWRKDKTDAWRQEMAEASPELASLSNYFVAEPGPYGDPTLCLAQHKVGELAKDVCSYCQNIKSKHGTLLGAVEASWSHLHREIIEGNAVSGDSSDSDEESKHGKCWLLGECICGPGGATVWQMRNRFLRILKTSCPFSGEEWRRAALGSRKVFILLKPSVPAGSDDEQVALSEFWGLDQDHRWFHISFMSFSPYEPMVETAGYATDQEALGAAKGEVELALKVCKWQVDIT